MADIGHQHDRNVVVELINWTFREKVLSKRIARSAMVLLSSSSILFAVVTLVFSFVQ